MSEIAKNFMCHLLVVNSKKRYTVATALKHPWVSGAAFAAAPPAGAAAPADGTAAAPALKALASTRDKLREFQVRSE